MLSTYIFFLIIRWKIERFLDLDCAFANTSHACIVRALEKAYVAASSWYYVSCPQGGVLTPVF